MRRAADGAALFASLSIATLVFPAPVAAQEDRPEGALHVGAADAVRGVVDGFHSALAAGDSVKTLSFLDPGVVIYEAGHGETLDQYRSGHLASDMEFSAAVPSRPVEVTIWGWPGIAVVMRQTRSSGTFRGRAIDAAGTETMVLVETEAGWKIRHIHWSSGRAPQGR